jgi:hypothetical protein
VSLGGLIGSFAVNQGAVMTTDVLDRALTFVMAQTLLSNLDGVRLADKRWRTKVFHHLLFLWDIATWERHRADTRAVEHLKWLRTDYKLEIPFPGEGLEYTEDRAISLCLEYLCRRIVEGRTVSSVNVDYVPKGRLEHALILSLRETRGLHLRDAQREVREMLPIVLNALTAKD